jgi:diguanylate cyclase (GGDEF)-like protein
MKELRNSIEKDLELLVVEKELIKIAELDVLTGIFNRRKTNDILVNEYKRSTRSEERFSVALFDLDNFKQINDTYGHEKGDQVLSAFANLVKARIRSTDTFGRWGGDEFLLICPGTNNKQTRQLISDLKNVVCADMEPIILNFSFSYGVAEYKDESSVEELLALADADMYKMKKEKN